MRDIVMVVVMLASIVLLAAYLVFCDRVVGNDNDVVE